LYIVLTIILTFDAITQYRQRHRCLSLSVDFNVHLVENHFPILFEPIALKNVDDDIIQYEIVNYRQSDDGFRELLKYLANFIFYRFGLEVRRIIRLFSNERNVFLLLDLLYNNSDCHWCSVGYCSRILFHLVGSIFNIK
jgi:hypothetical protein